jgi:hypothetical protein
MALEGLVRKRCGLSNGESWLPLEFTAGGGW